MKKYSTVILLLPLMALVLLVSTAIHVFPVAARHPAPAVQAPAPIIERTFPRIVQASFPKIHAKGEGTGSGVVVGCQPYEGLYFLHVLTAAHVVASSFEASPIPEGMTGHLVGDTGVWVEGPNYRLAARVIHSDPSVDLALLTVLAATPVEPIPIAKTRPEDGALVWLVGYPTGRYYITVGSMAGEKASSAPTFFGASGGGLLNQQGELVGIMSRVYRSQGETVVHMGLISPLTAVILFLQHQP